MTWLIESFSHYIGLWYVAIPVSLWAVALIGWVITRKQSK